MTNRTASPAESEPELPEVGDRWVEGAVETAPVPENEAERLHTLESLDILDTQPEEAYDRVVRLAAQLFGAPTALLTFIDRDRQWFKARVGFEAPQSKRCISFCQFVAATGEPLVVPDVTGDPIFRDNPFVVGAPGIRFYAGAPITLDGDHTLGSLCVIDYTPREPVPEELLARLKDLAAIVITTLERRREERETARNRERELAILGAALDKATDGVAVTDEVGQFVYMNDAHARVFGYQHGAELIGESWSRLYEPAERRRMQDGPLAEVFSKGAWTGSAEGLKKNGDTFPQEISLTYLETTGGLLCVTRDVTERKAMEARTQTLERELLERGRMEALGALAGGLAHEINTPAQYIGDNIDFLQDSLGDVMPLVADIRAALQEAEPVKAAALEERARAMDFDYLADEVLPAVAQCKQGVGRIRDIVTAIKRYAHPGGAELAYCELNEAVELAVAISVNQWKYAAALEKRLPQDLPHVRCNSSDVTQVLLNLIVNAAHAIEDQRRGTRGLIVIEATVEGDEVVVAVNDDGPGVPEELRAKIFDPFFTTKDVGRGMGQGLALCRSIVEVRHQGALLVKDAEQGGARFEIRLPIDGARQG
ncbi:MAG: ATP-binding protein [Marivibrio sp.]|uniref:ATP-binding protein n=1 Tax=Marivibrio sp. TaxID=2039719 RepID=UPI0032EB418E